MNCGVGNRVAVNIGAFDAKTLGIKPGRHIGEVTELEAWGDGDDVDVLVKFPSGLKMVFQLTEVEVII